MPYSFTQIEEDKTNTIRFVFAALIVFYFVSFWIIVQVSKWFWMVQIARHGENVSYAPLTFGETLIVLGISMIIGYGHWAYTANNLINKILGTLNAEKLDVNDTYHQMFANIVEEVSVATGGTKIEPAVIPTAAMNAFALSDFQGRHVIGVTRRSRQWSAMKRRTWSRATAWQQR
jgi:Zn-dependent protease with chaperone function